MHARQRHAPARLILLMAGLCLPALVAGAGDTTTDASFARAVELEKAGDTRQASDAYRAWLDAHSSPKDTATADLYVEALLRLGNVEPEARLVLHFLETAPLPALSASGRLKVSVALAELEDALGEVDRAQAAYVRAADAAKADTAVAAGYLLRSAALLYEEGQSRKAETRVLDVLQGARARADGSTISWGLYLLGRIEAATERPDDALRSWGVVMADHADSVWAPAACFGTYTLARSLGRSVEAQNALDRLKEKYPGSPEREIADSTGPGRLTLAPRPSVLLEPYLAEVSPAPAPVAAAKPTAVPAPAADPTPARVASPVEALGDTSLVVVLAGSYTNLGNAERHRKEIESRGFAARVAQIAVGGVSYFRVLVGEVSSRDAAITLGQRLKDKDLESTILVVSSQTGG